MTPVPKHAFKEWSRIVRALGEGSQSLILRKGGIHEGAGGFQWDHETFWLFPTRFHEEDESLLQEAPSAPDEAPTRHEDGHPESVEIRHLTRIESRHRLPDLATVDALEGLHFWTPKTLEDRFEWSDERCLWLAAVRVYQAPESMVLPWESGFGGCRSWLDLPSVPTIHQEDDLRPVLADADHEAFLADLADRLPDSEAAAPVS